jgi:hypothetical protein
MEEFELLAFDWNLSSDDKRPLPALLYDSFLGELTRYRDLLHRAKRRGALDYVAWITRNILKLRIWVEYCSQSQGHSEEFIQDAIRDLNDVQRSVGGLDPKAVEVLQKANKFIGYAKQAHKFKKVREAAQQVELLPFYEQRNKVLSKFAHPTAMFVLTPSFRDVPADKIRKHFVELGMNIAAEAFQKLDVSFLGETYRKYQRAMNAVIAAQPRTKRPF